MTTEAKTRTAVSTLVAAEGPQTIPFTQLERMAAAMAKSGMFAAKTPEGALSLLLIAQAENVHPAQALMDYDLIQNKPALKSGAMLARFQRAGGKVRWIRTDDEVAEGEFTHPSGGSITIKWDQARVIKAQLADKEMHKKYPAQMRRARVISEAIRAIAPQCIPIGMYTVEETQDMVDVTPTKQQQESAEFAKTIKEGGLSQVEIDDHQTAIARAANQMELMTAFNAAWVHGKTANDEPAKNTFKSCYDARKATLDAEGAQ